MNPISIDKKLKMAQTIIKIQNNGKTVKKNNNEIK